MNTILSFLWRRFRGAPAPAAVTYVLPPGIVEFPEIRAVVAFPEILAVVAIPSETS